MNYRCKLALFLLSGGVLLNSVVLLVGVWAQAPQKGTIAFATPRPPAGNLWLIDADGADVRNITNHDAEDIQPDWSPDSQKIAFVSDRADGNNIFVIGADGKNLKRLTNTPQPDTEPTWSPDGEKIVFTSARGGKVDIWVMDANGKGEPEKLTKEAHWNRSADWFDPAFAQRFSVSTGGKRPLIWGWLKRFGRGLPER